MPCEVCFGYGLVLVQWGDTMAEMPIAAAEADTVDLTFVVKCYKCGAIPPRYYTEVVRIGSDIVFYATVTAFRQEVKENVIVYADLWLLRATDEVVARKLVADKLLETKPVSEGWGNHFSLVSFTTYSILDDILASGRRMIV